MGDSIHQLQPTTPTSPSIAGAWPSPQLPISELKIGSLIGRTPAKQPVQTLSLHPPMKHCAGQLSPVFTDIYRLQVIHFADAFIQSDLQVVQTSSTFLWRLAMYHVCFKSSTIMGWVQKSQGSQDSMITELLP